MSDGKPVEQKGGAVAKESAASVDAIAELEKTKHQLAMKGEHDAA